MNFTVLVDDREKAPYTFTDIELAILDTPMSYAVTCVNCRLRTGDYSLPGRTNKVAVSRKSLDDLYATLAARDSRKRFEAELARLALLEDACVIVEADYERTDPLHRSTFPRQALYNRIETYRRRHPSIVWAKTPLGRRGGEILTFLFLMATASAPQRAPTALTN